MDVLAGLELGVTESSAGTVEIMSAKVTVATGQLVAAAKVFLFSS